MTIVLVILLVLVVAAIVWAVASYNGLVKLKNRIEAAWAQIDVQLKRRHDLIPNLVETVKGYAAHERDTLEAVIDARNRAESMRSAGPAQAAAGESQMNQALGRLFALSEAYPELKANQGFVHLQEELTASEDKIAYARQFYNDSVFRYNAKIESFPASLYAGSRGLRAREYFEAEGDARGPVQVKF
jgi:LemA protein